MVVLYLLMGLSILVLNFDKIIPTFILIFQEAFNLKSLYAGGFWGLVLLGVRRAVFSNESGVGNAQCIMANLKQKWELMKGLWPC